MAAKQITIAASCVTVLAFHLAGCTTESTITGPETSPPPPTLDTHAGHAHPTEGPHHGELIELGNEEYHAEVLHDEHSVMIYILNAAANKQIPIEATEITINTSHHGHPEQFQLAATPDNDDPPGKSSRFVSSDEELVGNIVGGAEARLVVPINGKSYRGSIEHDHSSHAGQHEH